MPLTSIVLLDLLEIRKISMTHSLTTSIQEMLAHLKRPTSHSEESHGTPALVGSLAFFHLGTEQEGWALKTPL